MIGKDLSTLTYKDIITIIQPDAVNDRYYGGVYGCPYDYFEFGKDHMDVCAEVSGVLGESTNDRCTRCWNRLYRGEDLLK